MTLYRRQVLAAITQHEYEGLMEVALQLHGYPSAIQLHNAERAYQWLTAQGYVDAAGPTLTAKGRAAVEPQRKESH
jgi:hypothetical protein